MRVYAVVAKDERYFFLLRELNKCFDDLKYDVQFLHDLVPDDVANCEYFINRLADLKYITVKQAQRMNGAVYKTADKVYNFNTLA